MNQLNIVFDWAEHELELEYNRFSTCGKTQENLPTPAGFAQHLRPSRPLSRYCRYLSSPIPRETDYRIQDLTHCYLFVL